MTIAQTGWLKLYTSVVIVHGFQDDPAGRQLTYPTNTPQGIVEMTAEQRRAYVQELERAN